ncbi:potassium transporter TrkA [Campylobacter sp. MIT 12-8780]|uniref:COG3400 family protein n=1 Tax=unclassified Campylobacter TaxID=2593542 RepID=UPI00115DBEE7|nr:MULTISPECIES: TrkA C-terminal domain-containing protein [unclassified Campylobacter]NDJ26962.1 potassium transporter TrkA [Campylobacter sp. MIT 19-121]TQR41897.1 potassium transporter TrkA [Campylobacter sp. MIT 12-8780]
MDKILFIVDGSLAKYFLERLCLQKALNFFYTILYYNDETISVITKGENIDFVKFDPTSSSKLNKLLLSNFSQIFIFLQDEFDTKNTYENIRAFSKEQDIVLMDFWGLSVSDEHCDLIDLRAILSNHLLGFLPDVALVAQNIGLNTGEIMEVKIPADSIFAYRHVGSIGQKRWRIALLYRNSKFIFVNASTMLMPNDSILLVGDPSVLQGVYHNIKRGRGQFPSPFGSNILALMDMKDKSEAELENFLKTALFFHSKTNSKKLIIRVINPRLNEIYEKLKHNDKNSVSIELDYKNTDFKSIPALLEGNDIGVIVTDLLHFERKKKQFFELKIPILKTGERSFEELSEAVILNSNEAELETQANVMIDLSKQLGLSVKLYHYKPNDDSKQVVEHFQSLSKLYNKEIKIINDTSKNPLLELSLNNDILQFVSFKKELTSSRLSTFLSTDFNVLYAKMNKNYQLFIPIS